MAAAGYARCCNLEKQGNKRQGHLPALAYGLISSGALPGMQIANIDLPQMVFSDQTDDRDG